jgi:hypothetical protein
MDDHPLRPLTSAWLEKIRLALDFKKRKFQDDANEALFFFHGPYDEMYGPRRNHFGRGFVPPEDADDMPRPAFAMTVNKVAEMVELFGPTLYHRNPIRQVNPRQLPVLPIEVFGDPADPNVQLGYQQMMQQLLQERATDKARASLLQYYLNYTPNALDLKTESRWAIDEALIKGMGCLFTEVYQPAGMSGKMIGSFYETVDNVLIDPDGESLTHAQWVARRCVHPVWQVEEEYGLAPGTLRGNVESYTQQASVAVAGSDGDYNRKRGLTNDLIVYWKIYSKMGLGGKLSGSGMANTPDPSALDSTLAAYGPYTYLVIAAEVPYPLNLPPDVIAQAPEQEIQQRVQWPTPFWADDSWPFTPIAFHWVPRQVWPMSHIKPGDGGAEVHQLGLLLPGRQDQDCLPRLPGHPKSPRRGIEGADQARPGLHRD